MGQLAEFAEEFLIRGGKDLGYQINTLPAVKDMDIVLKHNVFVWEYNGMTEREYYGGML